MFALLMVISPYIYERNRYVTHKTEPNIRRVVHKPIPISVLFEQTFFWGGGGGGRGGLDSAVGRGQINARRCCRGREFDSHGGS